MFECKLVQVAKVVNGIQEVSIKVNDQGYSPAAIIVQRGVKAKIKFIPEKLNSCNYIIAFPEYQGQLDLSQGQTETPAINMTQDFTFQCGMGMLHGYVKVVDDIQRIDLKAMKKRLQTGWRWWWPLRGVSLLLKISLKIEVTNT